MGGLNVKNTIAERFLQIVAPHLCFGCGKVGVLLCADCKYDITHEPFVGCVLCGTPNRDGVCVRHEAPFERAFVTGARAGTLKECIDGYKFSNKKACAEVLAEVLNEYLPALPAATRITTVPTVRSHVRQRGYDHAELLARHFAALRGLPYERILSRHSNATQHTVGRSRRQHQTHKAFSSVILPKSSHILLIDDIVTTGSTVKSVAEALRAHGATVWVAALAYQPLD